MFLIFDTETTGLPRDYNAPLTDSDNWPRLVQIAWQVHDEIGNLLEVENLIVKPEGFTIPYNAEKVHGISTEMAMEKGEDLSEVLKKFNTALEKSEYVIGHNVEFDESIIGAEYIRKNIENPVPSKKVICTKIESTDFCAIPGGKGGRYKWPQLSELHFKLFNENFDEAHNASADVEATARVFLELFRLKVINEKHLKKDQTFIDNFIENNPQPYQAHWFRCKTL
jgi:DNA polymerase-3 subunit alpha